MSGHNTALKIGGHPSGFGLSYHQGVARGLVPFGKQEQHSCMLWWGTEARVWKSFSVPTTAAGSREVMLHIGPAVINAGFISS